MTQERRDEDVEEEGELRETGGDGVQDQGGGGSLSQGSLVLLPPGRHCCL